MLPYAVSPSNHHAGGRGGVTTRAAVHAAAVVWALSPSPLLASWFSAVCSPLGSWVHLRVPWQSLVGPMGPEPLTHAANEAAGWPSRGPEM